MSGGPARGDRGHGSRRTSPWPPVAVLALVVLTGCSGFGLAGDASTTTVTPAAVPTDAPTPDRPPGLVGGTPAPSRLADAHADALRTVSFIWTRVAVERFPRSAPGNASRVDRTRVALASATRFVATRSVRVRGLRGSNDTVRAVFADGGVRYVRVVEGNRSRVGRGPLDPARATEDYVTASAALVERYLAVGNATVRSVTWRGETAYRVTGTGPTADRLAGVNDYRVEALVTRAGLVVELAVTYSEPGATLGSEFVRIAWRYERLGNTTVEEPGWVEGARNGSTS